MKVRVDISDPLLREARLRADRDGISLSALVERGLRQVVLERKRTTVFRLRRASFGGRGLRPEFADAGWDRIRAAAYDDRY